jgi:hypothetical protein
MTKCTVRSNLSGARSLSKYLKIFIFLFNYVTSKECGNTRIYHPDVSDDKAIALYEVT